MNRPRHGLESAAAILSSLGLETTPGRAHLMHAAANEALAGLDIGDTSVPSETRACMGEAAMFMQAVRLRRAEFDLARIMAVKRKIN